MKDYEKNYQLSRKCLKIICIVLLATLAISISLTCMNIYWFAENIGKYIMIIGAVLGAGGIGCCYFFSTKAKIKQPLWIHIIAGIVIAGILMSIITTIINNSQQKTYEENLEKVKGESILSREEYENTEKEIKKLATEKVGKAVRSYAQYPLGSLTFPSNEVLDVEDNVYLLETQVRLDDEISKPIYTYIVLVYDKSKSEQKVALEKLETYTNMESLVKRLQKKVGLIENDNTTQTNSSSSNDLDNSKTEKSLKTGTYNKKLTADEKDMMVSLRRYKARN